MNILILHNRFKFKSGEEIFIEKFSKLLEENNHNIFIKIYFKNTETIFQRFRLLFTQNFNLFILFELFVFIRKNKIQMINLHNPYPYISYSIVLLKLVFPKILFVHTIHNYRHFCANGLFYDNFGFCNSCQKNSLFVVKKNCKNNFFKSIFFMIRYFIDDKIRFKFKFDYFLLLNEYQRNYFFNNGVPLNKLIVFHNFLVNHTFNDNVIHSYEYDFIFIGRVFDRQKGFDKFHKLLTSNPNKRGIVCGELSNSLQFSNLDNISYTGMITNDEIIKFLRLSKYIIICSNSIEVFPNILLEAWLSNCIPVVPDFDTFVKLCGKNALYYKDLDSLLGINFGKNYSFNFNSILKKYSKETAYNILIENKIIYD